MTHRLRICAVLALAWFLASCQAAPVTGRSQLILLPESQDAEPGLTAYQQILSESKISKDRQLNRRVKEVGQRIAEVSPHPEWDWQFTVIEDDQPNAFALPGGKVGVNTGFFKVAKNDSQLATVMGHEVAHAIASRPTLGLVNGDDNLVGSVGEPLGTVQSGVPARGCEAPLAEHLNEAEEHCKPVEARASSSAIRLQRENSSVDRAKR